VCLGIQAFVCSPNRGLAIDLLTAWLSAVPQFDRAAFGKLQVMRALGMSIDPTAPVTAMTRSVSAPYA